MMDAIEKRVKFEAWRKSKYPNQPIGPVRACGTYWRTGVQRDWEVWQRAIAALPPPEGHVVVTRNEAGQAVAVTRQDDDGRILSVIAEFEYPQWQPIESAYAITLASAARAALPFIAYAFDQGIEGAEEAGRAIEAALEVQSQWEPISTAPKDGTFYLATNGKDQRVENCPNGHEAGIWHHIDGDWRGSSLSDDSTHWQPLPAPPEVPNVND